MRTCRWPETLRKNHQYGNTVYLPWIHCHLCLKNRISGSTTDLLTQVNKFLSSIVGTLTCVIRTLTNFGNESKVDGFVIAEPACKCFQQLHCLVAHCAFFWFGDGSIDDPVSSCEWIRLDGFLNLKEQKLLLQVRDTTSVVTYVHVKQ